MILSPPMNISPQGMKFIMTWEGFRETPYVDQAGHLSIAYGHKVIPGDGLNAQSIISESDAQELLATDLGEPVDAIDSLVEAKLAQCQFDALCSFIYNVGVGNFRNSSLLHLLNMQEYGAAACQFTRWCYVTENGEKVISQGLLNRRHAEQDLFNGLD